MRNIVWLAAWLGCGMAVTANAAVTADSGDYLFDALAKPAFASGYRQLTRPARLPAWVDHGGTSTPATAVDGDAGPGRIYQSCKPHDCASEQILIYYRPADGHMSGVFVSIRRNRTDQAPLQTRLQWLGQADGAERHALLERLDVN